MVRSRSIRHRIVVFLLALITALGISGCGGQPVPQVAIPSPTAQIGASAATSVHPIQASFFGMSVSSINDQDDGLAGWPTVPFSGCRLWEAHGVDVDTKEGQYSWRGLDRAVEFCTQHSKQVMFTFGNVPNWMNGAASSCGNPYCQSGKPPLKNDDWLNYVRAVVTRYKRRIRYYELWNEPNVYPTGWAGTVPQLMTLVKGEYNIIKQVDPDAVTISPTTGSDNGDISYFISLLENGAGTYSDLIGFHGYTTAQYRSTAETRSPEAIMTDLRAMQAAMAAHGLSGKKLVDAESSWNMCTDKKTGFCGNEDMQAAFLSVRYIVYAMNGLDSYWWYSWDGDTDGDSSWGALYHKNGSDAAHPRVTKAAKAYVEVQKWLVGAVPADSGCTFPTKDTWSCEITRDGGYKGLFVWKATGAGTFKVPSGMIQMRDLDGNTTTIAPGASIKLSNKPVLLENMAP